MRSVREGYHKVEKGGYLGQVGEMGVIGTAPAGTFNYLIFTQYQRNCCTRFPAIPLLLSRFSVCVFVCVCVCV